MGTCGEGHPALVRGQRRSPPTHRAGLRGGGRKWADKSKRPRGRDGDEGGLGCEWPELGGGGRHPEHHRRPHILLLTAGIDTGCGGDGDATGPRQEGASLGHLPLGTLWAATTVLSTTSGPSSQLSNPGCPLTGCGNVSEPRAAGPRALLTGYI